jgi:hypothetical protein
MRALRNKLGEIFAGCYALLMLVAMWLNLRGGGGWLWDAVIFVLTLPWSIGVTLIGFLLIHISSYGLKAGLTISFVLNFALLYFFGRYLSRLLSRETQ